MTSPDAGQSSSTPATVAAAQLPGALRLLPLAPRLSSRPGAVIANIPAAADAPSIARRCAADSLRNFVSPEQLEDVLLVVSELVTNVVRHGGPSVRLKLWHQGGDVQIEVTDQAAVPLAPQVSGRDTPGGRGLAIVEAVSRAWGVVQRAEAKTVWCALAAAPAPAT